jgi:hypothetical protein
MCGDDFADLSPDDWNLIQLYIVKEMRCPPAIKRRAEEAYILRDKMDAQISVADRWLRTHGFDYPVEVVRTGDHFDPATTGNQLVTSVSIAPVSFKRAELEAAVQEHFGTTTKDHFKKLCSPAAYETHWIEVEEAGHVPWPSESEDDAWAKNQGFSVESVRTRRRDFVNNRLLDGEREHIQKGGRRKPFPPDIPRWRTRRKS